MKKPYINTPEELLQSLKDIFPKYVFERNEYDTINLSYHSLLNDFIYFYGKNSTTFTERQLRNFAEVINSAVDAGGTLENAFSTCFLEHLEQIKCRKPLLSFLSAASRTRLHA